MNVKRSNGSAGDVVKAARDLIRDTPLADDRAFVHKLGLVPADRQAAVAKLIVSGERKSIAQALRLIERQAKAKDWRTAAKRVNLSDKDCAIHTGDCRDVLADVADRSVDLVFTDPPYGIGEDYVGFDDKLTRDELMNIIGGMARHLPRILTPNGSAFVMMSSRYALDVAQVLDSVGLYRQQMIIWAESFGAYNPRFWTDCFRVILHYTRDAEQFTFNHADTRTFILSWRNENGDDRQDQDGKLPGNVWGAWTDRELARRVGNAGERIPDDRAVNQLPVKLVERVVLLASNPGDTVLDPFHGTGTTARACVPHKRRYIGVEIDPHQAKASRVWIKSLLAGRRGNEA
ncbi:MAG: site-specific DNA-methyltransferase [Burkholderiales bacterium]|nr:site-specific DNA-methyltransferase [Phycisphaerae bacterium]